MKNAEKVIREMFPGHTFETKIVIPTLTKAREHYAGHADKDFFEPLIEYTCSGPIMLMKIDCDPVKARQICGPTNRDKMTEDELKNTIRGRIGKSTRVNGFHCSDSVEAAERELKIWWD